MALPEQYITMTQLEQETSATLADNKRFVMFDEDKSRSASLEDIKDHILGDMSNTVADNSRQIQDILSWTDRFATALEVDGEGLVYLLNNEGRQIAGPYGPFAGGGGGGGGGGSSNNAILTLINTSGWLSKTVVEGTSCPISFAWSSTEDDLPTGNGILVVRVNNSVRINKTIAQGRTTIDVSEYLKPGASNSIKITISDVYSNTKFINYTVSTISLSIRSSFDASIIRTGSFTFSYIPTGEAQKTVYFVIDDGERIDTYITSSSGRQQNQTIPALSHGAHSLLVYFEADIDGDTVRSNELYYDIIYVDQSSTTPIIASSFREETVEQYTTLQIPCIVYNPLNSISEIKLYANDVLVSTQFIGRTENILTYRADTIGPLTLKIQTGSVYKEFSLTVTPSAVVATVTTENMSLSLQSVGRSNLEEKPGTWIYNNIRCNFEGFNYSSNGWVFDDDRNTVLRVSGNAKLTIPYKLFGADFRDDGKTIEIDFATKDVLDYDAVILSCKNDNERPGLVMTSQNITFTSTLSTLTTQYKEDEHIRLSIVIEKKDESRLIMIYINGIPSGTIQYSEEDTFSQRNPADIVIGAPGCTIDIYSIRVYDNNLTKNQVLDNWIADEQNIDLMLQRYLHNDIYNASSQIVIEKLPKDLPYMILEAEELPQFKGDKKTITGSYTDPIDSNNSFTFEGCQINVQGTSSAVYARKNYDLQFKKGFDMFNGEHKNTFALDPDVIPFNRFVLKADVASSEGANNVELVKLFNEINPFRSPEQLENSKVRQGIFGFPIVVFWTNTTTGITSFLGKYNFNLPKRAPEPYGYSGDMESWEFQNNTSNLMLFKSDYFSMAPITDENGKTKEAWRYDYEARFPSDEWINIDKLQELQSFIYSTYREEATGAALLEPVTYEETYVSYNEIIDSETGAIDYEEVLVTENVTYDSDTAAYRLAKFREEFPTYADLDSFIFYYIFTEVFLMVDSRAKNLFIGFNGPDAVGLTYIDRKAVAQPYDMDTAIGTNNEGSLVFGYGLEDTDHLEGGANIFNGQDSVLWCNLRDAYSREIATMYKNLRSNGKLSYNYIEQKFEEHQAKWPEAIWIEDSWFKYIDPLIAPDTGKEPTAVYLPMLQGSKKEQRRWWLSNRFKYMDSKWIAGDALAQVIQLRGYEKADITVTPYADIYPTIKYASYTVQARGQHGQPTVLPCPLDSVNDTEIYIQSAPQIASVGDLAPLKVGFADFSQAIRLQSVKVGDANPSYENSNLTNLILGSNKLLQVVDARNCSALSTPVDLSQCEMIEYIYLEGTAVSSVNLPNGGILKTLHLPETTATLIIKNQPELIDLSIASYDNISKLVLENISSNIDILSILHQINANTTSVRLIGFTWEVANTSEIDTIFALLDTFKFGIDEADREISFSQAIQGTIHLPDSITLDGAQVANYHNRYPYITISAAHRTCTVIYLNAVGEEISRETVRDGMNAQYTGQPSKAMTNQYIYEWAGWSERNDNMADPEAQNFILMDKILYPCYTPILRTFTATFIKSPEDGGSSAPLWTQTDILYGETPVYGGTTPVSSKDTDDEKWTFYGWSPPLGPITENTTYVALFNDPSPMTRILLTRRPFEATGSMSYIGSFAFGYCSQLNAISFPNVTHISESAFYNCQSLTTMALPNLTTIGSYAFAECNTLKTVSLPKVTSMEEQIFRGCYALTTAELQLLQSVPSQAFAFCNSLNSIILPNTTTIGYNAFGNCGFSSISLSNVTSIKDFAFYGCSSLRTISFPKLTTIGYDAFGNCGALRTMSLPLVSIIENEGFNSCSYLMNVNLPNLQILGQSAFAYCSNLASISLPNISIINSSAFNNCLRLQSVYILTSIVPVLENVNAFANTPLSNTYQGTHGSIYVLESMVSRFSATAPWNNYASRLRAYMG